METVNEILDRAIKVEEESYRFYMDLIKIVKFTNVKETLKFLAEEELNHKKLLEGVKQGKTLVINPPKDLKLSDHLPKKTEMDENADIADILELAMSRERSEYEFYKKMEEVSETNKELFSFLAQQEIAHKAKIEEIYDEIVYKEF